MLTLVVPVLLLMTLKSKWNEVQMGLGFFSMYLGVKSISSFYMNNITLSFGIDYLSYILIYLSVWIFMLAIMSSEMINYRKNFKDSFLLTNLILLFFIIMVFLCTDYLMLYVFFEASLIPTLIMILGWGYQPERIQAGIYMLFYTLTLSLPLLSSCLLLYGLKGSLCFPLFYHMSMDLNLVSFIWYMSTIAAFLVKMPMYLFHLWLPKAHVESPVAGSMILAGILLKLGGYGLFRFALLFQDVNLSFNWLWVCFGLVGGTMISLVCLRQVDMKLLIAYSSVAHMSLVLCGLVMFGKWGLNGAIIVMVGHGLCSSGLFCISNMVYERTGSRSLFINKGLISFMPSLALWWFLLSISNMAAPPSLNFLGEVNLIISVVSWSKLSILGLMLLSFFGGCYTVYLYSVLQHGTRVDSIYCSYPNKIREYLILFLHWLPLNVLILNSKLLMN